MAIYYGWIICISCLVLFSTSTGILYGFSQMIIPMSKEFNASISTLGWIGSLPCGVSLIAAPLTNYINRCLGTRTTVLTGISISSLALASAYMAEDVIGLLIFHGITNGIGILLALNPPFFLVGEYFPYKHRRYVFATSLIVCGFPLANLVFNPIVWALLSYLGWRRTYLVFAGMLFVIGGGSALTFRPCQLDELAEKMAKPENSGAVKTCDRSDYQEIGIEESRRLGANQPDGEVTYTTAGKVFLLLVWLAASTFKAIGYFIPIFTLMKQMEVLGISTWRSSKVMILYAACELVSRLSMSLFGDNVKGKILQTYVICCASLCLINIFGSFVSTFSGLLIFAAGQGLASGPVVAAMYSCCAEVMNQQCVEELYSLFRTGLGIGSLIGQALAGYIYDNIGSFRFVFYLTGALYAITGLMYALIIIINNRTENRCFFKTADHITSSASEELLGNLNKSGQTHKETQLKTEDWIL